MRVHAMVLALLGARSGCAAPFGGCCGGRAGGASSVVKRHVWSAGDPGLSCRGGLMDGHGSVVFL